jgi:hypothetical protein
MRIQVLLPCLLLLALGGLLISKKSRPGMVTADAPQLVVGRSPTEAGASVAWGKSQAAADSAKQAAEFSAPAPVGESGAQLLEWATGDDIAVALADADAEKRADARQAAVQSGDRSLIPVLQSAAERVTDAREKAALLEAADFLALPTMSEAQAGE